MGEQGAESIHAHMMRLERIHQGIANDVDRLKYIVKEHMLESAPSLTSLRPPPKRGKRNESPERVLEMEVEAGDRDLPNIYCSISSLSHV